MRSVDVASWAGTTVCEECISCPGCDGCDGACKKNARGAPFLKPEQVQRGIVEGMDYLRCAPLAACVCLWPP